MPVAVDTCILLDIALNDPIHGVTSADTVSRYVDRGVVICPVTFVELAPQFDGELSELRYFLGELGIDYDQAFSGEDRDVAAAAFTRYRASRKNQTSPKRPVADILIGAFACRFDGLLTRNQADFRILFPELELV